MDGFDLFSQEEMHDSKEYRTIKVKIDFLPSADKKNHAVNIVKSKKNKEKRIHILDTRCHKVGGKIDSNIVILSDGLATPCIVPNKLNMFATTYYRTTNYHRGLHLLNLYDTDIEADELQSIIYGEP